MLSGKESNVLYIYSLEWFVALWNESKVNQIGHGHKNEICLALIEATF